MSRKKTILRDDLASLLKKFSSSDVVGKIAKEYASASSLLMPLGSIVDNRYLAHIAPDRRELEKMMVSLQSDREVAPLVVRPFDGRYEIVLGRRRYHAALKLGMNEVPVIVKPYSDVEMLLTIFVNLRQSRENYSLSLATLGQALIEEFGYSQAALGQVGQMSRPTVANFLRMLRLPLEIQTLVSSGELSYGHARALINVASERQIEYLGLIKSNKWSVRQLERAIAQTRSSVKEDTGMTARNQYILKENELNIRFKNQRAAQRFLKRLKSLKLL